MSPDISIPNLQKAGVTLPPPKPAGALADVPATFNLQSPLGFRFFIKRAPNTNYYVNRVNIPGIQLPAAEQATPYYPVPWPGDHLSWETLILNFRVDEGMNNYFELHNWMMAASTAIPSDYATLSKTPEFTGFGVESEIVLAVQNAQKNVIRIINFHYAWPTVLKMDASFDTSLTEVHYVSATCVFKYLNYDSTTQV